MLISQLIRLEKNSHQKIKFSERVGIVVYLRLKVARSPLQLVVERGGLGQPGHDQQTEQDGHHYRERKMKYSNLRILMDNVDLT